MKSLYGHLEEISFVELCLATVTHRVTNDEISYMPYLQSGDNLMLRIAAGVAILHAVLFCASAGLLRFARNDGSGAVIASEAKQSGKKGQCANSYRAKYNCRKCRSHASYIPAGDKKCRSPAAVLGVAWTLRRARRTAHGARRSRQELSEANFIQRHISFSERLKKISRVFRSRKIVKKMLYLLVKVQRLLAEISLFVG